MPYFVYRVEFLASLRRLRLMSQHQSYSQAQAEVRSLRTGISQGVQVKMIFADNELAAEELLGEFRPPEANIADDY
jgi:hypothetical protein